MRKVLPLLAIAAAAALATPAFAYTDDRYAASINSPIDHT